MNKRPVFIASILVLLVLAGAGFWYLNQPAAPAAAASAGEAIGKGELHSLGNPAAKVTLIEYAALTCPVCAAFNQDVFPGLKQKYIDTGKVFYVYRLLPIDVADPKAEKIASCLPPSQYFSFVDMLYRRQADWGPEQQGEHGGFFQPKTEAGLLQMARVAGMSVDQAKACMTSTAQDARINRISEDGVKRYGLHATPTLVINGQVQPPGPVPLGQLSQLIDPLLAAK